MKMQEGNDITLVITVRGPKPWSRMGGKVVRGMLKKSAEQVVADLAHLHSEDKPEDWRAVEIHSRVFQEDNPNRW